MPNKPKSMRYTTLGYYVGVISEKWRTLGTLENLTLNADHEIEVRAGSGMLGRR